MTYSTTYRLENLVYPATVHEVMLEGQVVEDERPPQLHVPTIIGSVGIGGGQEMVITMVAIDGGASGGTE